ncbi:MAG TPA: hypothetical protein VK402_09225 [Blastococcus sp.]|nr:hypothetical protein [Blastococcus sp.]
MTSSGPATSAAAARMPSDRSGGRRSLEGLIDVLDRADGAAAGARPRPARRATFYGPAGFRSGAVRTVPLRSVQPAPLARPVPGALRAVPPVPPVAVPSPGRGATLHGLVRRAALWGAGPRREYLAWQSAVRPAVQVPVRAVAIPSAPAPARPRRTPLLTRVVRRAALWGAGPQGEHLAWGRPARPPVRTDANGPVVLRELPSTPTIQPAATSPAAALVPPAPAAGRARVVPSLPLTPRGTEVGPSGSPRAGQGRPATGWPASPRSSSAATGLIRTRGDPLVSPARGSPPPARRSRSPGSVWSSFP